MLSEGSLKIQKDELEQLLLDPNISDAGKAEARKSIAELNTAINVIQRSPVLKDAAELGLIVADVLLLGELAATKALTSTLVKEFVFAKTGKAITPDTAAVIANNFYREGAAVEFGGSRVIRNPNEAIFGPGGRAILAVLMQQKTLLISTKGERWNS